MKVWLFGLSAGLSFVLLITAGSINSTEIQEEDSDGGLADAYIVYALFFGLDPTNAAETALDYDGDNLSNWQESFLLTDPFCEDTDRDGFFDDVDENPVSRAYLCWGNPQFTTGDQYEYAHPDWLLGAYKNGGEWVVDLATTQSCWRVAATDPSGLCSLNIDLDRSILTTNNLRYAIHYEGRAAQPVRPSDSVGQGCPTLPSLYVDLLNTNGVIVAGDLFGNLLTVSNVAGYAVIPALASAKRSGEAGEAGIQSNNAVLLAIPTATFPSAAVIQLRCETGELNVYEGLLYIDEDGDGLDADQEKQIGTSDYSLDSNNNGTNDYDECFNSGSSTNSPDGGDGGGDDDGKDGDKDKDKNKGIIYVDQAKGNDNFTGRASVPTSQRVGTANKGPKKTVHGGLSVVETNDTIIIRSGNYNENLDIRGRDVKVFIEGNVRL